jgi:hypothetical protein
MMGYFDDEDMDEEQTERRSLEDARQRDAEAARQAYDHWLETEARAVFKDFLRRRAAMGPPDAVRGRYDGYLVGSLDQPSGVHRYFILSNGELSEGTSGGFCEHVIGIQPPKSMAEWDADAATKKLVTHLREYLARPT